MGRNRDPGSSLVVEIRTADFETFYKTDVYGVDAAPGSPVTVTLSTTCVDGDQVCICDVRENADLQPITITTGGFGGRIIFGAGGAGDTVQITEAGGSRQFTYLFAKGGWSVESAGSPTPSGGGEVIDDLTTAAATAGRLVYYSAADTVAHTDATAMSKSRIAGLYAGIPGEIKTGLDTEPVEIAMTTDGGAPTPGNPIYAALATADGGTGAGKGTATAPSGAGQVVAQAGICINATNYPGSKTARMQIQVKDPIQL